MVSKISIGDIISTPPKIAIIGLGYVGLPLAIALARHFPVTGFDINPKRISELKEGYDRTHEIQNSTLKETNLEFTSDPKHLLGQNIYIVTVPTPVTQDNLPDLSILGSASKIVGEVLSPNSIVVFESTVYPGVTENYCGPILEKSSGLKLGKDFFLGYSPERINPGDTLHTVERITKVVSGQTPEVAELLKSIYGTINNHNIFVAKDIKTAEAAKVIENAQRDINIAFINEIAIIVNKLGISIYDVLEAAETKWNFLKFKPGLVGGHCIGVDPYYLAECSKQVGHTPEVILSGRKTNELMSSFIAFSIEKEIKRIFPEGPIKILVLGLTFKEDIPDLRNTKVVDLINYLKTAGHSVDIHDPLANREEALSLYQIPLINSLNETKNYDCIIGTVPHQQYIKFTKRDFEEILKPNGLIADIKKIWNMHNIPKEMHYWIL